MIPQFLDIGAGELLAVVVIAVLVLGPDKVPELGRKAARVLRFLRGVANTATDQLKAELGPEFADLTPADLRPSALAQRVLPAEVRTEMDALRSELAGVRTDVERLRAQTEQEVGAVTSSPAPPGPAPAPPISPGTGA